MNFSYRHRKSAGSQNEMSDPPGGIKSAVGLIAAWLFLNILMNINYPAPQENLLSLLTLSPEVLFLMGGLWLAVSWGMPSHWSIYLALTLLVGFFRLFRVADELVPMYFFRPFNLYIDSQFFPVLMHLLYKTLPLKVFIIYNGVGLLLIGGITAGLWWAFKTIRRSLSGLKKGRMVVGAIIALFAIQYTLAAIGQDRRSPLFHKSFFHRIIEEVDFILHVQGYRTQNLQIIRQTAAQLEQTPSSLDKLAGADVYLIFIESYGRTLFAKKRLFESIEPVLNQYQEDLYARGFSVHSGFLRSPAFGGSSWLAHGTIASGVDLSSQLVYDLLITSDATSIAHLFNRAGYRTVSVMPANEWPWPEGKFFGYQKHYSAWDFPYKGARFGWSPMADQYVVHYIHQNEILPRTQPLFIEFVLSSSHAPFHHQPPYLQNWSQIGDGSIYHRRPAVTFPTDWPDLTNASEAYVTAIIYELTVLKNFIEQSVTDDALIIIMGDHQPNVQITGPDSSWSVPVHVISRNKRFLDPFENKGYTPGLIPRPAPPHPGMQTFLPDFLKAFSSP